MKQPSLPKISGKNRKIAIILPYFNEHIGKKLLKETVNELILCGCSIKNIRIERVPGALEIPLAAKRLALSKKYNAIIALGIVIRGETIHFELVSYNTYYGLLETSLETMTPIIFGVLTVENEKQALERVKKGKELARSALLMLKS